MELFKIEFHFIHQLRWLVSDLFVSWVNYWLNYFSDKFLCTLCISCCLLPRGLVQCAELGFKPKFTAIMILERTAHIILNSFIQLSFAQCTSVFHLRNVFKYPSLPRVLNVSFIKLCKSPISLPILSVFTLKVGLVERCVV